MCFGKCASAKRAWKILAKFSAGVEARGVPLCPVFFGPAGKNLGGFGKILAFSGLLLAFFVLFSPFLAVLGLF